MPDPIRWRTQAAERIAAFYAGHQEVEAVALIGSVAHGWADAYSDIEIAVFWRSDPTEERRRQIAAQVGASDRHESGFLTEIQAWCEDYALDGVKIDLGHWLTTTMGEIVTDVADRSDDALSKQTSVSALLSAIPLHGDAIVREWQEEARQYPHALAEKMVRQNLNFSPAWMLDMLAQRGDFPLVRRNLAHLAYKLFRVLCGLNRVYYPGHKWLPHYLKSLHIAPSDFCDRLDMALVAPLPQAASEFKEFILEVIGLVEVHLPTVATAAVKARLNEPPHFFS